MLSALADAYSRQAIAVLLALFHNERDSLDRIIETFEIDHTSVRRSVSMTLTLPTHGTSFTSKTRILVPILRTRRGALIDNLDVEDTYGRSVPVLSRIATRDLSRLLLQVEVDRIASASPQEDQAAVAAWGEALVELPTLPPDAARRTLRGVLNDTKGHRRITRLAQWRDLIDLADFFASSSLKLGELQGVRPGDRLILKYAYDAHFENTESHSLNRKLGQRPYTFRFYTPLAFVAPSYHVRMRAPRGHYCAAQSFELRVLERPVAFRNWLAPADVECEQSADRGLPYAHLYVNGLNHHHVQNLTARIQFFEFPPGSQGVAFGLAVLAALLLGPVAGLFRHVVEHSEAGALLLALVGIVAVWMRPTFESDRLLQAPLSAKLGLFGTGAVALLAALDLVVASSFDSLDHDALWISEGVMWALFAVAIYILFAVGRRLWTSLRKRPV